LNFKEYYEEETLLEGMDVASIVLMATSAMLLGGVSLYALAKGKNIAGDLIDSGIDTIIKKIKGKDKYKKEMSKVASGELKISKASQIISKDKKIKSFVSSFWEERNKGKDGRKQIDDLKDYIDSDLTPEQTKAIALEIMKAVE